MADDVPSVEDAPFGARQTTLDLVKTQHIPGLPSPPSGAHFEVNVVWTIGACLTGCPLDPMDSGGREVPQWP
jgi:hypothetical protein